MINKVILLGNVGGDPDIKMLPSGGKVANISLATTETWRDRDGNKQNKTEWHRITVFNENLIKIIEQYVHKGSKIYVEGSIKTRKYSDKDGIERKATDIVVQGYNDTIKLLDTRNSGDTEQGSENNTISSSPSNDVDDEIPF